MWEMKRNSKGISNPFKAASMGFHSSSSLKQKKEELFEGWNINVQQLGYIYGIFMFLQITLCHVKLGFFICFQVSLDVFCVVTEGWLSLRTSSTLYQRRKNGTDICSATLRHTEDQTATQVALRSSKATVVGCLSSQPWKGGLIKQLSESNA